MTNQAWCPTCRKPQEFLVSETKGICLECNAEISGHERMQQLQDALILDHLMEMFFE